MSRKSGSSRNSLPRFVPLFYETLKSPAYRQLSFGARALFTALRMRCIKNNGHVYLSQRDAGEELGHKNRNDIGNWFRELQHFGFIVQTEGACLGVDGNGKAPHWRITDMPVRNASGQQDAATKDFLRWDGELLERRVAPSRRWKVALEKQYPGLHVRTTLDSTCVPQADSTSVPPPGSSGTHVESISTLRGGTNVQSISRLATGAAGAGSWENEGEPA